MEIIAVASDHAGFHLKQLVINYLKRREYQIMDFGCFSDQSCDYPDYAHPLASAIEEGKVSKGIVFCGSGNGINMTVNKHQGIRSAICWTKEIALLARNHNDANICSIPARFITEDEAYEVVDVFLREKFDGGRHQKRIEKIPVK
jgi:ribose 5-phosphate isomerase B